MAYTPYQPTWQNPYLQQVMGNPVNLPYVQQPQNGIRGYQNGRQGYRGRDSMGRFTSRRGYADQDAMRRANM